MNKDRQEDSWMVDVDGKVVQKHSENGDALQQVRRSVAYEQ